LKNAEARGRSGRLSQLENREFSLGALVGDIGKQWTLEWQQGVLLNSTVELNDALATLKSSQRFGEHQMMEKRTIYSWFSTRTMEHSPCRIPWQPARSPVSMATLCFELGDSLPHSTSLSFAVGFGAWGCC
jgi:hypothetical protein